MFQKMFFRSVSKLADYGKLQNVLKSNFTDNVHNLLKNNLVIKRENSTNLPKINSVVTKQPTKTNLFDDSSKILFTKQSMKLSTENRNRITNPIKPTFGDEKEMETSSNTTSNEKIDKPEPLVITFGLLR
jgi:hypothetical protein